MQPQTEKSNRRNLYQGRGFGLGEGAVIEPQI